MIDNLLLDLIKNNQTAIKQIGKDLEEIKQILKEESLKEKILRGR